MIGRVVSNKMTKSAVVLVESKKKHPLYGKIFSRTKKYIADDPVTVKLGDIVELIKIKPISKNKHWRISRVLGKDIVALGTEELKKEAKEAIEKVLPEGEKKSLESSETESKDKKIKRSIRKEKLEKGETN